MKICPQDRYEFGCQVRDSAERFLGTPYCEVPHSNFRSLELGVDESGMDCSGLVIASIAGVLEREPKDIWFLSARSAKNMYVTMHGQRRLHEEIMIGEQLPVRLNPGDIVMEITSSAAHVSIVGLGRQRRDEDVEVIQSLRAGGVTEGTLGKEGFWYSDLRTAPAIVAPAWLVAEVCTPDHETVVH